MRLVMTFSELLKHMREFNSRNGIKRKVDTKRKEDGTLVEMKGRVVFKPSSLNQEYQKQYGEYSRESRTFDFNNYNKALTSDDGGYSIFAYCPTDKDSMRIESYSDDDFEECELVSMEE